MCHRVHVPAAMVDVAFPARDVRPSRRPLTPGGLLVLLSSVATSALSLGALPARFRIHWTFGLGPYYGPEFAPTAAVLVAFPLAIAGLFAGARLLASRLPAEARPYYDWGVLLVLLVLLFVQVGLVLANLA